MSTPLPPGALNTPPTVQPTNNDVYSRMLKRNFEVAMEDIIITDEMQTGVTENCTCGKCGSNADFELIEDEAPTQLAGAPRLYIETRGNSDPLVLDEMAVSADLEILNPRWIPSANVPSPAPVAAESEDNSFDGVVCMAPGPEELSSDDDYMSTFNPTSFNPFDPGIDEDTDLSIDK